MDKALETIAAVALPLAWGLLSSALFGWLHRLRSRRGAPDGRQAE